MPDEIKDLLELLNRFDCEDKPICEAEIQGTIAALKREKGLKDFPFEFIAELMAFGADEKNTLLGEFKGEAIFTILSCDKITQEIITYWESRLQQSANPVIKARYAALIWDQTKIVTGKSPNYQMAQIAIDSILTMADSNRHSSIVSVRIKLENAMQLSFLINDCKRVEKIRDCIIAYEDKIAKDDMLGTWGFSFDIFWGNKKIVLTDIQWEKIITDLEARLQRVSGSTDPSKKHPFAAEAASRRLALFYQGEKKTKEMKRVLDMSADIFESIGSNASPMLHLSWMQNVHSVYKEFGLDSEAEEITKKIRKIGPDVLLDLKQISSKVEIPKEELNKAIEILTEGGIDKALSKIALYFIPNKNQLEDQLRIMSKLAPISFLFSTSIVDHEGRIVCTVPPLKDDLGSNMIVQISENMSYMGIILNMVLKSVKQKYVDSEQVYIDHLFKSPVFLKKSKPILISGFKEYLSGNHLCAIHLLIPQIECAFRNLLHMAGSSVLKQSRYGGWDLKLLHEILSDPILLDIFNNNGQDAIDYFKALLTDPRGWNLRNSICHGFIDLSIIGPLHSERILHVLLCLAQVKQKKKDS